MERAVPVRKPHTNTADLLSWSATGPDASASPAASSRPSLKVCCCLLIPALVCCELIVRPFPRYAADLGVMVCEQPAAGITPAMFGAPVTEQEAEDLSKR